MKLSDSAREAYRVLDIAGAHYVLATSEKRPVWGAWQRRRPLLEQVLSHNGPIGLIPWSIRSTGLDVDQGDPAAFIEQYPPRAQLDSKTAGRKHLYYNDTDPRRNVRFSKRGIAGDVRSAHGYLILWNESVVDLVAQWVRVAAVRPFPSDLFDWAGVEVEPGPPVAPLVRPEGAISTKADVDLSAVAKGARNDSLFDSVRWWAYRQRRGKDIEAWNYRVLLEALNRNQLFATPLERAAVECTAYSISTWTWAGNGAVDHSPPLQALRGVLSGRARRSRRESRDAQIVDDYLTGLRIAQIAREQALTENGVRRVIRRDSPQLWAARKGRRARRDHGIVRSLELGATQAAVATRYGLSQQTVSWVKKNTKNGTEPNQGGMGGGGRKRP